MNYIEILRESFNSIKGNKLRTTLTALIISIGIMALVGILTSIDGIKSSLSDNFALMGANSFKIQNRGLNIRIGGQGRSEPKTYKPISFLEAVDFKSTFKSTAIVSVSTSASRGATIKNETDKTNPNISVLGGDEAYAATSGYKISSGRNFTSAEVDGGSNVTIIGDEISKKLFKNTDPLGKLISIGSEKFTVIGQFESKGSSIGLNGDKVCLIPLLKGKALNNSLHPTYSIVVQVQNPTQMEMLIGEAKGAFRNIRKLKQGQEENFDISKSDELINQLLGNLMIVTVAATAIGIITLFGASIALMNIMLVSVTERTREIGIRKAIGATSEYIRRQFLAEALVICQLGGIGGIFLGILIGNGVSSLIGGGFIIPWLWIAGGILVCVFVGIFSGLYPAIKASRLDPVEALRYE